jgi:hypothetical protein
MLFAPLDSSSSSMITSYIHATILFVYLDEKLSQLDEKFV